MSVSQSDVLTSRDAAQLLGVDVATVARLARAGELRPLMKFPGLRGARVFHRDEVARLAAERNLS